MPSGHFAENLIGQRFGRLVVVERLPNYVTKTGQEAVWKCQCDCGAFISARAGQLRGGHVRSCGCLQRESASQRQTKHGGAASRLYGVWSSMKRRCNCSKDPSFERYGGRGITVCKEWQESFAVFQSWAFSHGYQEPTTKRSKLSIDRINNDGNYCPENCRWATDSEQARNQRPRKRKEQKQ